MSGVGERDDAPELEVEDGVEIEQGSDGSGADEDGADDLGEEPGSGDDDHLAEDDGPEDDGQEGGGSAPVAVKPRSAATIAVQEAKRAAKEAKAEAEATRRELAELRQAAQGRQTAEQASLERERIALMSPEEKYEYLLNKQKQETDTRLGAIQFQMQDASDRTGFEGLCARNPAFEAVRDEVEKGIVQLRNNGGNTTRENLAIYLIGKRALDRATKGGKTKQASKGQARVAAQTVRAPAARGDVPGGQRRGTDDRSARAARLDDQQI